MEIICKIDQVNFKDYGVYVSSYSGLLSRPKPKKNVSVDWPDYNGIVVDLSKKFYEPRELEFSCFIKADSQSEFVAKCNTFLSIFDKPNTRRIEVFLDNETTPKPLPYEVYLSEEIEIKKTFQSGQMVGTFTLKLTEPEPIKKVFKYTRTGASDSEVTISFTSSKMVNIYWGDGSHSYDFSGEITDLSHTYAANGTYYIVMTGNIDEISDLSTTAVLVWNKL